MKLNISIFLFLFSLCSSIYAQNPITKIFFEEGYRNCKAIVSIKTDTIFNGVLTSKSSGAAEIVEIKKLTPSIVFLKICGKKKSVLIKPGKFYRISILENKIDIKEVDDEPFYVDILTTLPLTQIAA